MNLGAPVQLAYGVDDVWSAAEHWHRRTGAGPFFVVEHIPLAASRVDGVDATFDHSSAYGQWGPLMVELVQEHTPPLVSPGSGLHHVAFMVHDLAEAMAWCGELSWPERLWARTAGGMEFAFVAADVGHLLELYEPSPRLVSFYEMVATAGVEWDGAEPVRRLD